MTATTDDLDTRTKAGQAPPAAAPAAGLVAYAGAAAFVVAAVWYGLAAGYVTVARPPAPTAPGAGAQLDGALHRWFGWFATTLAQERLITAIAITGFLCLLPLAAFTRELAGRHRLPARIGSAAMAAGALLWVAGNVVRLGGHRAVGLMATHQNPIQTINAILFTTDTIADTFELAAFAVLGVALVAFAGAAAGSRAVPRAWCGYSLLLGVVLLGLSGAYAAADDNLINLFLVAGGALLLPAWLVWTGHLLRAEASR